MTQFVSAEEIAKAETQPSEAFVSQEDIAQAGEFISTEEIQQLSRVEWDEPFKILPKALLVGSVHAVAGTLGGASIYTGSETLRGMSDYVRDQIPLEMAEEVGLAAGGTLYPTSLEGLRTWAAVVAGQAPILLSAMIGRKVGAVVGPVAGAVAGQAGWVAGPKGAAAGTAFGVKAGLLAGPHAGGIAAMGLREADDLYVTAMEKGIDPEIATYYAGLVGPLSGTIEYLQAFWMAGGKWLKKAITGKAKKAFLEQAMKVLGNKAANILVEGLEEVSQEALKARFLNLAIDEHNEKHGTMLPHVSVWEDWKRNLVVGMGVSGVFNLAFTGPEAIRAQRLRARIRDVVIENRARGVVETAAELTRGSHRVRVDESGKPGPLPKQLKVTRAEVDVGEAKPGKSVEASAEVVKETLKKKMEGKDRVREVAEAVTSGEVTVEAGVDVLSEGDRADRTQALREKASALREVAFAEAKPESLEALSEGGAWFWELVKFAVTDLSGEIGLVALTEEKALKRFLTDQLSPEIETQLRKKQISLSDALERSGLEGISSQMILDTVEAAVNQIKESPTSYLTKREQAELAALEKKVTPGIEPVAKEEVFDEGEAPGMRSLLPDEETVRRLDEAGVDLSKLHVAETPLQQQIHRVIARLGYTTVFTDQMNWAGVLLRDQGLVVIGTRSTMFPSLYTIGTHEATHGLPSDIQQALLSLAKRLDPDGVQEAEDLYVEWSVVAGMDPKSLTPEVLGLESLAVYMQRIASEPEVGKRIFEQDPTLWKRLVLSLREAIFRLKDMLGWEYPAEQRMLNRFLLGIEQASVKYELLPKKVFPELQLLPDPSECPFPDSVIKNVVFHGTTWEEGTGPVRPFTHFGTHQAAGDIFTWHTGPGVEHARIYPAWLNLRNPLELDDRAASSVHRAVRACVSRGLVSPDVVRQVDEIYRKIIAPQEELYGRPKSYAEVETAFEAQALLAEPLIKALEEAGYDGIYYINAKEDRGSISYVIFHPEQVQSALTGEGLQFLPDVSLGQDIASRLGLKLELTQTSRIGGQVDVAEGTLSVSVHPQNYAPENAFMHELLHAMSRRSRIEFNQDLRRLDPEGYKWARQEYSRRYQARTGKKPKRLFEEAAAHYLNFVLLPSIFPRQPSLWTALSEKRPKTELPSPKEVLNLFRKYIPKEGEKSRLHRAIWDAFSERALVEIEGGPWPSLKEAYDVLVAHYKSLWKERHTSLMEESGPEAHLRRQELTAEIEQVERRIAASRFLPEPLLTLSDSEVSLLSRVDGDQRLDTLLRQRAALRLGAETSQDQDLRDQTLPGLNYAIRQRYLNQGGVLDSPAWAALGQKFVPSYTQQKRLDKAPEGTRKKLYKAIKSLQSALGIKSDTAKSADVFNRTGMHSLSKVPTAEMFRVEAELFLEARHLLGKNKAYKRRLENLPNQTEVEALAENLSQLTETRQLYPDQLAEVTAEFFGRPIVMAQSDLVLAGVTNRQFHRFAVEFNRRRMLLEREAQLRRKMVENPEAAALLVINASRASKSVFKRPWRVVDQRYWMQAIEGLTDLPFTQSYEGVIDGRAHVIMGVLAVDKRLQQHARAGRIHDPKNQAAIEEYIRTRESEGLAPDLRAVGDEMIAIMEEAAPSAQFLRMKFYLEATLAGRKSQAQKLQVRGPFPNKNRILERAQLAYIQDGDLGLQRFLDNLNSLETSQDAEAFFGTRDVEAPEPGRRFGLITTGYTPLENLQKTINLVRQHAQGRGAFARTAHLQPRKGKEVGPQKRPLIERFHNALQQINFNEFVLPHMQEVENLTNRAVEQGSFGKYQEKSIQALKAWRNEVYSQGMDRGIIGDVVVSMYNYIAASVFLQPRLAFRNLFQNIAMYPHRADIIKAMADRGSYTEADKAYFEMYVTMMEYIKRHYLAAGSTAWKIPGLHQLATLANRLSLYGVSDDTNRKLCFRGALWGVRQTLKGAASLDAQAAALTTSEYFQRLETLEKKMVLEKLLLEGPESAARAVAREITNQVHFVYDRAQRAPIEMGLLGRVVGNLMTFPRSVAQRYGMTLRRMLYGPNRYEAGKRIINLLVGMILAGELFKWITNEDRNPYDPIELLAWQPGGLQIGASIEVFEVGGDVLRSITAHTYGDTKTGDYFLNRALRGVPRIPKLFLPFLTNAISTLEASLGKKNILLLELRKVREAVDSRYRAPKEKHEAERELIDALRHAFLANRAGEEEPKRWRLME